MSTCYECSGLILAQINQAPQKALAEWIITELGLYGLMIALLGVALFFGACVVVAKSRRPALISAYLFFVPLPLIAALVRVILGLMMTFLAVADGAALKQDEVHNGVACQLLLIVSALLATLPAYLVIVVGYFVRMIQSETPKSDHN